MRPWYTFEHKGRPRENIVNEKNFRPQHFLLEYNRNNLQGLDNHMCCHQFRSLQMIVLVLFLLVECVQSLCLSIGAYCYVWWHCSHSPLIIHISKFCCPPSTKPLFGVQRNDSMSFQRWGLTRYVCALLRCLLLVVCVTNDTYTHRCLPLGLCILNFGHPCSLFSDYHAFEKDPG